MKCPLLGCARRSVQRWLLAPAPSPQQPPPWLGTSRALKRTWPSPWSGRWAALRASAGCGCWSAPLHRRSRSGLPTKNKNSNSRCLTNPSCSPTYHKKQVYHVMASFLQMIVPSACNHLLFDYFFSKIRQDGIRLYIVAQ